MGKVYRARNTRLGREVAVAPAQAASGMGPYPLSTALHKTRCANSSDSGGLRTLASDQSNDR